VVAVVPPSHYGVLTRILTESHRRVQNQTMITATVQFTDSNSNYWEAVFQGPATLQEAASRAADAATITSAHLATTARRISLTHVTGEQGRSRLRDASGWPSPEWPPGPPLAE
jgi:hypothetical protein